MHRIALSTARAPVAAADTSYRIVYSSGGRYAAQVTPSLRGAYLLSLSFEGAAFGASTTIALAVSCVPCII